MGRITSFSKQVIVFFLVTALIIRPTFAANVGGWTLGGGVAQGASTVYEGTKKVVIDGVDYIKKGTAKITPPASGVAKVLARGAAGYALSVAVDQLLGAVDWVLDPANNSITYTPRNTSPDSNCNDVSCVPYATLYSSENTYDEAVRRGRLFATPEGACSIMISQNDGVFKSVDTSVSPPRCYFTVGSSTYSGNIYTVANPTYDPTAESENKPKHLPLETVAQKVISNAAAGNAAAQVATTAAAADIVAEAEKDNVKARPIAQQLEASSSTKPSDKTAAENANTATGTQTQNPTKPEATDLKLEFPAFCGWAPIVCEAAQKVISFPITLTEWWETSKTKSEEWATSISESWTKVKEEYNEKPKENTDTELDIPDPTTPDINTDISFGGSCPASRSVPVSFAGISTEIEFSFQWFCEVASIAKPVVISISAFAAALIVAGVRTEDD